MTRPLPVTQALAIARSMVGHSVYQLGTGDCDTPPDEPTDCAGLAICKAYGLRRHRPGFNRGSWASVSEDINSNSLIEDAIHTRELARVVKAPEVGDLLAYPTIRLSGHTFIGHVVFIESCARALEWNFDEPDYSLLDIIQSCGPNGRRPGVIRSDASHFNHHDHLWPKPQHRTVILRMIP